MKSKLVLALHGAATMGVLCTGFQTVAHSQAAMAPGAPIVEPETQQLIRVHNLPPSWMAWWLDPSRHAMPLQISRARENADMFPETPAPTGLPVGVEVAPLPTGISRIVAIDPQNALSVWGTKEALQELQKVVELLDKPLRQIEVEARYVEIAEAEVAALPIEFGAVQPDQPHVGAARAEIDAAVAALIAQGKAKMITAPRVMAISGLMASLKSTMSTPFVIASKDEDGTLRELFDPVREQAPLFFSTTIGLNALPTLSADQTVTLRIALEQPARLTTAQGQKPSLDLGKPTPLLTFTNVRDGEVRVVKGLDSRIFRQQGQNAPPKNILVLVTTRLVKTSVVPRFQGGVVTVALPR